VEDGAQTRPGRLVVILLIRHGRAGKRSAWAGDDSLRPLDSKGRRQAAALPALLAGFGIERILSSPYRRCVETVEPLAAGLRLDVEQRAELAEGADPVDVGRLLNEVGRTPVALCTHGDVIAGLIGAKRKADKGSVWVIEAAHRSPVQYLRA
jgi:broad specificity phosphatase PhoE